MNTEEEFYLGNTSEDIEFFLGNSIEEVYLGNNSINSEDSDEEKDKSYQELLEIYELLKIDAKPYNVEFEEFFKDNPEIFKVADVKYFQMLSADEYKSFEKKCEKLVAIAHKKWISIENQKNLEDITDALDTLKRIFKYPDKTKDFINEIKRTLKAHLNAALRQKLKDGILEVSEIQELMEIAVSIRLISDSEEGRKIILKSIKSANERNFFKIESFQETFIRVVLKKDKIERLNTDSVKRNLFKVYKNLSKISDYVLANEIVKSDELLFEEMCQLLSDNNVLISNIDLFTQDFLEPEIQKKGEFHFQVPLNNDYYYYLKGTAINKFELTEDQWRQISMIRNIRNESDFTVAFIMGYKKESSVEGIIKLIQENPAISCTRILAGDLETYFSHIGRKNIAIKISNLKEAYKSNSDELVTGVVELLKTEMGNIQNESVSEKNIEKESFHYLLEKKSGIKELVSFVVKHKSDEKLYLELTKESSTIEKVQTTLNLKAKKYSYIKFLLNILNELLLETDISQYKSAFIKTATKVQNILNQNDDFMTFIGVYMPLVEKAIEIKVLNNSNEISDYSDIKKIMEEKFNEEPKKQDSKEKKKSRFGFFKKEE